MREIKFRIYFEDEETFMSEPISLIDLLHEDWIEFESTDNTLSLPLKDFRFFYEKNKNYKIMQYTGLKDKNGTEIYEGDIIRIDKEDYKYIVKFYDGCFVGVSIYDEHYEQAKILGNLFTLEIEVIGNVYDNPELLENIKDKE